MAISYAVSKISDSHYRISEGNVFMELLIGTEKALLIDTGFGCGDLKRLVRSITGLPLLIVNTHGHPDHACGNWQFEETVWINRLDLDGCFGYNTPEARRAAIPQEKPDDFQEEAYLRGGTGNLAFTHEGQVFDLGGLTLEVVNLPGHTAGSIGLLDRKGRQLFVGDAMNKATFLFQQGISQSLSVYIETVKKARELPADILWLSHMQSPQRREEATEIYLRCAQDANWEQAFPCGRMLDTEDVRLFVCAACRDKIDPDNLLYSVYAAGLMDDPSFCAVFLSKYTL